MERWRGGEVERWRCSCAAVQQCSGAGVQACRRCSGTAEGAQVRRSAWSALSCAALTRRSAKSRFTPLVAPRPLPAMCTRTMCCGTPSLLNGSPQPTITCRENKPGKARPRWPASAAPTLIGRGGPKLPAALRRDLALREASGEPKLVKGRAALSPTLGTLRLSMSTQTVAGVSFEAAAARAR